MEIADDSDASDFVDIIGKLADHGVRIGQKAVLDRLGIAEPQADEPLLHPARTPLA